MCWVYLGFCGNLGLCNLILWSYSCKATTHLLAILFRSLRLPSSFYANEKYSLT
uniref:Uncharacterized protein n=1 Tax=Arundo donax TaxID=35708 RepID=A0A0A8YWU7_ARUDO